MEAATEDSTTQCVFGPVPSRRLGRSLGVDPVPLKTCNWNCVYCQLGRTSPLTNERREYVAPAEVVAQVEAALRRHAPGRIDWVTFLGSGEPTLNAGLGAMIRGVKALTEIPVAVLTNGALLYQPEVRQDLMAADAVMPTVDAGSRELYRTINRPHPDLTFERHVEGLTAFRRAYAGRLWVEVVLVHGINDTETALRDLAAVLGRIAPDEIHLSLPIRPPAEPWVRPADEEGLMRATALLGEIAHILHPAQGEFDLSGYDDPLEAALAILSRHPMREEEMARALDRWSEGEVAEALDRLAADGRARLLTRYGRRFWTAAGGRYPEARESGPSGEDPGRHR